MHFSMNFHIHKPYLSLSPSAPFTSIWTRVEDNLTAVSRILDERRWGSKADQTRELRGIRIDTSSFPEQLHPASPPSPPSHLGLPPCARSLTASN